MDYRFLVQLAWCFPPRVKQLGEVDEGEALGPYATTREVEDDGSLHRGEQRVSGAGDAVIEEVGLVDAPVLGFGGGLTDYAECRW